MLSEQFFVARPLPTIVFGNGVSLKLADQLRSLGQSAALVVTDRTLASSGILDPVLDRLNQAGVRVEVFDGVKPNPTDKNVESGAARLRELGGACVLAFGGGSSMDCGKAVALLAANRDSVETMQASKPTPASAPVIAVPTTAGTGSETNNACVITNTGSGRKTYVMHPSITPAFAVLDPELSVGLPPYPTATCGFDVLTHAVEAFVSARASAYSDALAMDAMRKVAVHLRAAVADGSDIEARAQMLLASAMAAMAFNVAGLGAAHGTGHALSARLAVAHGQSLATMLPHVMDFNINQRADKFAQIAGILAPDKSATASLAIDTVLRLRADIQIDRSLRDLGAAEDLLPVLVADASADMVNRTNPRMVNELALESLYRAAW